MALARRGFLRLFGAGIGIIAAKSLSPAQAPRGLKKGAATSGKMLVAHRGASAYAPEHTLESYQLALAQGADFVEQDLQITRDGVLVCLHDLTLERTTNVKEVFARSYREEMVDGIQVRRWYVSDFTLSQIKQLDAGLWFNVKFRGARVPTFQEAIDLIKGKAGLYPETKAPEVYIQSGFEMERLLLKVLKRNRLEQPGASLHTPVIIQSFSPASLRRLSVTLEAKIPLVLLVGDDGRARWLTAEGLVEAKQFATGIGPGKALVDKNLVMQAHTFGLSVTPYTFRSSNTGRFKNVSDEMSYYLYTLGVDAVFTDNPDLFPRAPVLVTRLLFVPS